MITYDLRAKCDAKDLLYEIDMEIAALSKTRVQNDKFDIDCNISEDDLERLIIYRRILARYLNNEKYAQCGTNLHNIYSRVRSLISVNTTQICVFNRTSTTTTTTTTII